MINILIIEIKKNRMQFTIFSLGTYTTFSQWVQFTIRFHAMYYDA